MTIHLNEEICVGCGCCSDVCRQGALGIDEKAVVYEEHCIMCGDCIDLCPVGALSKGSEA